MEKFYVFFLIAICKTNLLYFYQKLLREHNLLAKLDLQCTFSPFNMDIFLHLISAYAGSHL